MDEKVCHHIPMEDDTFEALRVTRHLPPAHYSFKVESFSMISRIFPKSEEAKYESDIFEAGGYKWRLSFYPNGRKERNGKGHISLYLVIAETETLPLGLEVNTVFRLFVLDQIRGKYTTGQDAYANVKRFHAMKSEWGFDRFLSLAAFNDTYNGYLIDDCCVFGAEVFVIKCTGKGECLSMMREPIKSIYIWKIDKFSALNMEFYFSDEFTVGERKWKLMLYPNGISKKNGKHYIQMYLSVCDWETHPRKGKLYAKYTLRIRDQICGKHEEITDCDWFSTSSKGYGYSMFLSIGDLNTASKGFLVNDSLIVEAEIEIISVVKNFSEEV